MDAEPGRKRRNTARERILQTAYDEFSRRGIRAVGVDEVVARSGVAKATLYRHFHSKDDLALAFLDRREQLWTDGLVVAESYRRGRTAEERLLAIFDVLDDWVHSAAFDGPTFVSVLLELGADHPLGRAAIDHLRHIRTIVRDRARQAGLADPDAFSRSWQILMKGSIIAASEGDLDAPQRARRMARDLVERHRPR
jgi:AcrR family transcriptional regulator